MKKERNFSKGKSSRFNKSTPNFKLDKKVMKVSFFNENDEKESWLSPQMKASIYEGLKTPLTECDEELHW